MCYDTPVKIKTMQANLLAKQPHSSTKKIKINCMMTLKISQKQKTKKKLEVALLSESLGMNELLPHKKTHKHKHCIQTHTLARLFIFKTSSCSSLMQPDWINHNWDPLRHIPNLFITIQLMNFTLLKWRRREWGSLYFTGVSVHYKSSLSNGKRSSGMRARSVKGMDNALWLVTCLGRMHFISAWDRDDWLDMRSTRIPLREEWQRLVHK